MKMLLNIYNDMKEQMREETRMKLDKKAKNKVKYEKAITKLSANIDKNIGEYNKYELSHTNKAVVAYVMLRSMEGKERLIHAYRMGAFKRCCLTNFCCQGKAFKSRYFMKKWLRVKNAKAPDIINWENLRTGRTERAFRITFATIVSIVLIAATFVLLLISQYYQKEMQSYSPVIDCPKTPVTQQLAYDDQIKNQTDRVGLMHCFCLNQFVNVNF
jgi:hypothetical protein